MRLHDARGLHASPQHILLRGDVVTLCNALQVIQVAGMGSGASVGATGPRSLPSPHFPGIALVSLTLACTAFTAQMRKPALAPLPPACGMGLGGGAVLWLASQAPAPRSEAGLRQTRSKVVELQVRAVGGDKLVLQ